MAGDGIKTDPAVRAARSKLGIFSWIFSPANAQTASTWSGLLALVLGGVAAHYGLPPEVGAGVAAAGGALIAHNPNAAQG